MINLQAQMVQVHPCSPISAVSPARRVRSRKARKVKEDAGERFAPASALSCVLLWGREILDALVTAHPPSIFLPAAE
jgi:hypothetical protein